VKLQQYLLTSHSEELYVPEELLTVVKIRLPEIENQLREKHVLPKARAKLLEQRVEQLKLFFERSNNFLKNAYSIRVDH
jgi:uncharacterized membrane-anchored protein